MTPIRLISRVGTVHEPSGRTLRGYLLTMCGLMAERGWDTRRQVPVREVNCNRCILALRKRERPKTRRKGQPVAITWDADTVSALVAGGRDEDPYRVGAA